MNINLDNYESFFLMYVDNELSAAERKNVEEFLGEYPYLQEEMNLLKETVLRPEENHFAFKEGLLKPIISEEQLQENLLLNLDDELSSVAKQNLEKFLLTDARLQQEWALLKRTKLDASETVAFPGKNDLYRHEAGKLVIGRFARWAVAAAIIAGGFFVGITFFNKQATVATEVAGNEGKNTGTVLPGNNDTGLVKETPLQPKIEIAELQTGKRQGNDDMPNKNLAVVQQPAINNNNNQPVKHGGMVITNTKRLPRQKAVLKNEILPQVEPVLKGSDIAGINKPIMNEAGNNTPVIAERKKHRMLTDTNIQPVENLFARSASLEADEENSDNHIFMMDEEKVSRTKAAGFFKKIKRTVERTTKIKPGNSLRIAGFEFAVK